MINDVTGKLKKSSDKIWKELENILKGKITASTIYLNFLKNRGNILNRLMKKSEQSLSKDSVQNEISDLETLISDEIDLEKDSDKFNFKMYLTFDDYRQLEPEIRFYERGNYTKSYTTLKPHH